MRRHPPPLIPFIAAALMPGCLSTSYMVPRAEVDRLIGLRPAQRARHIHVVQRFVTNDDPPPAPPFRLRGPPPPPPGDLGPAPAPVPPAYYYSDYFSLYGAPTWNPLHPVSFATSGDPSGAPGAIAGAGPAGATTGEAGLSRSTLARFKGTRVDDAKAAATIGVVAAVGVGFGLALTEGIRYDGYVAVHPDHPIHLMGPGGSHRLVPLSRLGTAAPQPWEEVVIVRHEGIGMWELGRAPLTRRGLTYSLEFGSRTLPVDARRMVGATAMDFHVGLFPHQVLGLLGGVSLGFGGDGAGDVLAVTPRFEVQAIPIRLGRLYLGGYAGLAAESVDVEALHGKTVRVRTLRSTALEAGALVQLEITTRLATTFRWGVSSWTSGYDGALPQRLTLGLAVY